MLAFGELSGHDLDMFSGEINLGAINRSFGRTEHGQQLAQQVRYERYKHPEVTNEQWVDLLGGDVNNYTHMRLTWGVARDFVRITDEQQPDLLNEDDRTLLEVAAMTHDWGEAIIGDITCSDKTVADEEREREEFFAHLGEFYAEKDGDTAAEIIYLAARDVVFDTSTPIGQMFNAIEKVGYMRTALRAHDKVAEHVLPICDDGLLWLVADVMSNHVSDLVFYASKFEAVRLYLAGQQERISAAMDSIAMGVFANYGERAEEKIQAVAKAYLDWQSWLTRQNLLTEF